MVAVHRKSEINLFGTAFPILGAVRPLLASQFAPKQVIGDYTKDSGEVHSSWVISDQRGGIGVKDMEEFDPVTGNPKDVNRAWFSDAWLSVKGHRTLPPLATVTTNPTGADAAVLIEFDNRLICVFGVAVYRWVEATLSWTSLSHNLISVPTGAIVHKK